MAAARDGPRISTEAGTGVARRRLRIPSSRWLVTAMTSDEYGLTGMRERAELLGGRLSAGRTDDGFRVELWLPA